MAEFNVFTATRAELQARIAELESSAVAVKQLAAENVELKSSRSVLAENTLESCNSIACAGFRHEAIMRGLYASTGNGNKYPKPITTLVDEAMRKLETPATDSIVAGIKADGVEEFAAYISLYNSNAERHALDFAKQLREDANK